jgi:hypothetical protein
VTGPGTSGESQLPSPRQHRLEILHQTPGLFRQRIRRGTVQEFPEQALQFPATLIVLVAEVSRSRPVACSPVSLFSHGPSLQVRQGRVRSNPGPPPPEAASGRGSVLNAQRRVPVTALKMCIDSENAGCGGKKVHPRTDRWIRLDSCDLKGAPPWGWPRPFRWIPVPHPCPRNVRRR